MLVIGGANLDITAQSGAALVQGDSNPGFVRFGFGGVARNIAENLARLRRPVDLMTVVGDDPWGQQMLASAQALGIGTQATQQVRGAATPSYLSVHGADGDMVVAVNDMALLSQLGPEAVHRQAPRLQAAQAVVADCNLGAETLQAVLQVAGLVPVAVDAVSAAKCLRVRPLLHRLWLLKLNALEAQTLVGFAVHSAGDAQRAAQNLCAQGVQQVLISLGGAGAVWCERGAGSGQVPCISVAVQNTSGAGDALMAGTVYGRLQGWPLERAVAWGMACAALTVGSAHANAETLSPLSVLPLARSLAAFGETPL